jgi:hypothetical protein
VGHVSKEAVWDMALTSVNMQPQNCTNTQCNVPNLAIISAVETKFLIDFSQAPPGLFSSSRWAAHTVDGTLFVWQR